MEDLTSPAVHVWRLLRWGRVLARHGALRGIEPDPNTPPPVRRLCRIARFGARVPKVPAYAEAFQAIGPAAIKLGHAMAPATSSTEQDIAIGRPTEIDSLNGYVAARGEALGVPTPVNRALAALVRVRELADR